MAGLLELARLLGKSQPTRAIELVAYTLEEWPHFRTVNMGSAWHARTMGAANREVELMLSLEMIGYFSQDSRHGQGNHPPPCAPSTSHPPLDYGRMAKVVKGVFAETQLP